jgi:hypothetical protein
LDKQQHQQASPSSLTHLVFAQVSEHSYYQLSLLFAQALVFGYS